MLSAQKLQVTLLCSDKCSGSVCSPLLNYSHQKVVWSQTSKFPDLFWFFLQNASNRQASLKTWNFHENQIALFRKNSIFCQQRCCRKYNITGELTGTAGPEQKCIERKHIQIFLPTAIKTFEQNLCPFNWHPSKRVPAANPRPGEHPCILPVPGSCVRLE